MRRLKETASYLSELVDGEALTTCLLDTSTSSGSEAEGGDAELGDFEQAANFGQLTMRNADNSSVSYRVSSVILPITTTVFLLLPSGLCFGAALATMRERDIGGPDSKL